MSAPQQYHSPSQTASSSSPPQNHGATNTMDLSSGCGSHEPMRNYDGTEMRDANSNIVYKAQMLATHPLRSDCKERVGYGGKKFTYVSGDGVIR